ncbi:transcription factor TFIIIB component B'' homolog [Corticium candelabrum]|uniref:transcription factor TFIIIB component B'' homolog n=1 Tax=Corticium candelabrum TaxID=121492 RepID=UPI002E26FED5|nr:transcription factor TFIIIB component B'' homolog [Corticium candelabrum]
MPKTRYVQSLTISGRELDAFRESQDAEQDATLSITLKSMSDVEFYVGTMRFKPTLPQRTRQTSRSDPDEGDVTTSMQQPERGGNEAGPSSTVSSDGLTTSLARESRSSGAHRRKRPVPNIAVASAKRTKEATGQQHGRKEREQNRDSVMSGDEVYQTSSEGVTTPPDKSGTCQSEEVTEAVARTADEEKSQTKKRSMSKCKEMPSDTMNLKMCDLLYYNPKSNPMKKTISDGGRKKYSKTRLEKDLKETETETEQPDNEDISNDNSDMVVPRVKVGPDGSIIIDQESLVLQPTRPRLIDLPSDGDVQEEEGPLITSASFRKRTSTTKAWTKEETERLYEALSKVGTDFSLMVGMFPGRTRKQIKAKFKREEKYSCARINEAINKSVPLQESTFSSLALKAVATAQPHKDM